jgi:predicted dehydrogenase
MKVRIGIIGPGRIAERFASVARASKGVQIIAAASRDRARAEAFAAKFDIPKVAESYLDLARDASVDAVYIALTHNFHYEAARLCLENGKAVLCEKPLATTKKDAKSLAAIAEAHNVLLMEAMWSRCVPATIRAKEWARSGRIGRIRLIDASFCFKAAYDPEDRLFNPALAGGALYDAGVYPIEFATGMTGESPSAVEGVAAIGETGVEVFDSMSLGFPSGAVASLKCGLTARVPQDAFVYGGLGSIAVYGFLGPKRAELFDAQGKSVEVFEEDFDDGFIYEIEHFAELYRDGKKESDLIPLRDSIACAGAFDTLMGKWGLR